MKRDISVPRSLREFEEMVLNRPAPDMPGYYRLTVWRYSSDCKGDYSFKRVKLSYRIPVCEHAWMGRLPETGIFTTLDDAIAAMKRLAGKPDILSFEIEKFPYGDVANRHFSIDSLQYDSEGHFVQRGSCSVYHYETPGIYGKFFGHFPDKMPYKIGDIVTVIISEPMKSMKYAVLGVVAMHPKTIKDGYSEYKRALKAWVKDGNAPETWLDMTGYSGSDEDEYFIQIGAMDKYMQKFTFINPMAVMPAPTNLPDKVKADLMKWYGEYLEYIKKVEEEEKATIKKMCNEIKNENGEENSELPVMMYLHGFMSGANGAKQRQLQKLFKGRYRVIAPELDADPDHSLDIINKTIETEKPEIIIGTSLGGWMAIVCDSGNADIVVVNPVTRPEIQLKHWVGDERTYFCKRLDGVQTYTLTDETLNKYTKYSAMNDITQKRDYIFALCSTADELLGTSHVEIIKDILPQSQLMIVDDFGHQCKDAGMTHLYNLIEQAINKRCDLE